MGKYCCFSCPAKDYGEKDINDVCPACGKPYGFMLEYPPSSIREYEIIKSLDRGFYGATYIAQSGDLIKKKFVIKISPTSFYDFFEKKPFSEEVELHNRLTESGCTFIVQIQNAFYLDITFSDPDATAINCYVTVLEYVKGSPLSHYLNGKMDITSRAVTQIAIDLLSIRYEFEKNKLNHNDFHSGNIIVEELDHENLRNHAIDNSIRLKAIDLGSIADESKSGQNREGDLLLTAKHIDSLLLILLDDPDSLDDKDYGSALALQGLTQDLIINVQKSRLPNLYDLINDIEEVFYNSRQQWKPWKEPLRLKGFGDHFNAQTLSSWHVPKLLVDPKGRWLKELSKPGPQIITGMRGCGKTMLLRALDLHARAASTNFDDDEKPESKLSRIKEDGFIGLFVRAQRLLELRSPTMSRIEVHISKLFISYCLEAVRVLMHINDIDNSVVIPTAHKIIASVVADCLDNIDVDINNIPSLEKLETTLEKMLVLVTKRDNITKYSISLTPETIFCRLAEELRKCSFVLSDSYVIFLLDDVSTRYLSLDQVQALISALLFQSASCAFKFTSEWQTYELGLQSPGRNHPIMVDRDVAVFDLGADVFKTIKREGNSFVEEILKQRTALYTGHPLPISPKKFLGSVSLETVAKEIAESTDTSTKRKHAYRGLTCLSGVCVGDIGDIIKLYEEMLLRGANKNENTIPQRIQAECFQELSARRLYELNRRQGFFKDHALQFAQAAHELLIRSHKEALKKQDKGKKMRLRQYSSIYIRVTTDDSEETTQQIDLLRELIDAGVFVYTGGAPRTKTRDSNPTRQFKLTFRKIYGLASYIGLADRDRFELSGSELRAWLSDPSHAKEILLRNQIESELENSDELGEEGIIEQDELREDEPEICVDKKDGQLSLFSEDDLIDDRVSPVIYKTRPIDVSISQLCEDSLSQQGIKHVVSGLGFEERTLEACRRLSRALPPCNVIVIKYDLAGKSEEILKTWEGQKFLVNQIKYVPTQYDFPRFDGPILVDITGLSKPMIFSIIKNELTEKGEVYISHATAKRHYPLQEDINDILSAKEDNDITAYLEKLSTILMGEIGPYSLIPMLAEESDPSRDRTLLAFSSAKHERLFSLLEEREYDNIEIITSSSDEPRSRLATLAARFLCDSYSNAGISYFDTNDLEGLLYHLDERYLRNFSSTGANLEIGLTGSKLQAVAAAILSSRRKVSQAWYISPKQFDAKRFTEGFDKFNIYKIKKSNF